MTDEATRKVIQETARATAKAVAYNVGRAAARDTLVAVGIDPDDPISAQENAVALRKIAEHAPVLEQIAKHYRDPDTVAAIHTVVKVHKAAKSTRNRVFAGAGATLLAWLLGVLDSVKAKLGIG